MFKRIAALSAFAVLGVFMIVEPTEVEARPVAAGVARGVNGSTFRGGAVGYNHNQFFRNRAFYNVGYGAAFYGSASYGYGAAAAFTPSYDCAPQVAAVGYVQPVQSFTTVIQYVPQIQYVPVPVQVPVATYAAPVYSSGCSYGGAAFAVGSYGAGYNFQRGFGIGHGYGHHR